MGEDGRTSRRRGFCAECGYAAVLGEDNIVPQHVVRRIAMVNGKPRAYPGTGVEDDVCPGGGSKPTPMETRREPRKRMAA